MELLANPVWNSLRTCHAHLARSAGELVRYPAEVAPFVGFPDRDASTEGLDELAEPSESVVVVRVFPDLPRGWQQVHAFTAVQYVWPGGEAEPMPEARPLGTENLDDMMALTGLVYPAYFRRGTPQLGDYCGIYRDGSLVAMAGIRMAMPGFQEISAICTHPDFRGQGLASRLTRHLITHIVGQGDVPFLHTEEENTGAQAVYERLGFARAREIPVRVWQRDHH